jgi:hypothetical protein
MTDADDAPLDRRKTAGEAERWSRDLQKFDRTRLERVQASARVWLGVLTTLLGLLGSVVLFKGGDLVTGVTANGLFQGILIVLVGVVFAVTILAVIFGGQATWGGLAIATQQAGTEAAVLGAAGYEASLPSLGLVTRPADPRPLWRRAWFSFAALLALCGFSGTCLAGLQGLESGQRRASQGLPARLPVRWRDGCWVDRPARDRGGHCRNRVARAY